MSALEITLIVVLAAVFILLLILPALPGRSKSKAKNHQPDKEFHFEFNLFPDDEENGVPAMPGLKCSRCKTGSLTPDHTAEQGDFQSPDGTWWVCKNCDKTEQ